MLLGLGGRVHDDDGDSPAVPNLLDGLKVLAGDAREFLEDGVGEQLAVSFDDFHTCLLSRPQLRGAA